MKLFIFLLLLSANCLGQKSKPENIQPYTREELIKLGIITERMTLDISPNRARYIGTDGIFIDNNHCDDIDETSRWQCSHRWVELHQDTVETYLNVATTLQYPPNAPDINLICLICHQEKKKVIHYKREQ
jgi:hypothetical protein